MPEPRPGLLRVEHVMGMPVGVDVRDAEPDPEAFDRVFAWLRLVDARFSTYRADSEISRLNRGERAHPQPSSFRVSRRMQVA